MSASCQKIDLPSCPRKDIFSFFSVLDQPFYSVCFRVDVTQLHAYVKAHSLSFYYAMTYLVTQAVNEVENLRYTIRDDSVFLLDKRTPSFTELKKGSEQFRILTVPWDPSLPAFCRAAKEKSERQIAFLESASETDDLLYLSCLPWFPTTAFSLELQDAGCLAPVITWGRYESADGRTLLPVSLRLNHAAADGWHASLFLRLLEESAANFNILS